MVGLQEGDTNNRMRGADKVIVAVKAEKVANSGNFRDSPEIAVAVAERICQISESCSQMVLQFHSQIQVIHHI
ncbi:hypothetical protein GBA52_001880 [Prunus armeniaca]|nr:hypothetical protein GBA52_001880 [Prunus armeniaca]